MLTPLEEVYKAKRERRLVPERPSEMSLRFIKSEIHARKYVEKYDLLF